MNFHCIGVFGLCASSFLQYFILQSTWRRFHTRLFCIGQQKFLAFQNGWLYFFNCLFLHFLSYALISLLGSHQWRSTQCIVETLCQYSGIHIFNAL